MSNNELGEGWSGRASRRRQRASATSSRLAPPGMMVGAARGSLLHVRSGGRAATPPASIACAERLKALLPGVRGAARGDRGGARRRGGWPSPRSTGSHRGPQRTSGRAGGRGGQRARCRAPRSAPLLSLLRIGELRQKEGRVRLEVDADGRRDGEGTSLVRSWWWWRRGCGRRSSSLPPGPRASDGGRSASRDACAHLAQTTARS